LLFLLGCGGLVVRLALGFGGCGYVSQFIHSDLPVSRRMWLTKG
jgi:hypothetical protein